MSEKEHTHGQCKEMLGSLGAYIDGELSAELCAEIERHMHGCERCRVVVNTLKKTVELYQETASHQPGERELPPEVRQRLYARLNLDDFQK